MNALIPLFVDSKGREVLAPDFGGAPVADTHAHLDMLEDPALALARAALAGVRFVATVADVTEDAWRTFDELPSWLSNAAEMLRSAGREDLELPRVRVVVGAHPHNAKEWSAEREAEFRRLAADPLTCAVGEMGLDYHYDHSPRDVQRSRFAYASGAGARVRPARCGASAGSARRRAGHPSRAWYPVGRMHPALLQPRA